MIRHFTYKSLEEISLEAEWRAPHVRFESDRGRVRGILGSPVQIGDRRVGNSLAIHPMEGCDGTLDGRPGELTWRRYKRFAAGGATLIWFEATAIREDGRANTRQLWLNADTRDDFARLIETIRRDHAAAFGSDTDLLIPMQLTHSGRYSVPHRVIAYHNPHIDRKTHTPASQEPIADEELERLEDVYVEAAGRALDAGFDAIDIKITHGYLLSELMGAKTRPGLYGGALENRLRLPLNVIRKVRARFGKKILIGARLGCFDGVPYGCDFESPYPYGFGVNPQNPLADLLDEVKQAIGMLRDAGLELLNVSLGVPYYNPHVVRPFERPDDGNYESPEHPMEGVDRHFRIAGELQRTFPDLPMVGSGYSWLQKYSINAAAHNVAEGAIRIAGLGRNSLAYPDFGRDALDKGELDERRTCKTLTYCTYLMRRKDHPLGQFPTGCPPFDKEGYGQIMKEARTVQRIGGL